MKNIFKYIAVAFSLCTVFAACTSDDDEPKGAELPVLSDYIYINGEKVAFDKFSNEIKPLSEQTPEHPVSVTLSQAGTLAAALSGKTADMDALTIAGPVDASDMRYVVECARNHYLIHLDLTDAVFANNTIPDGAMAATSIEGEGRKALVRQAIFHLSLPKNIEVIGEGAFRGLQIVDLEFPVTLQVLKSESFRNNYLCSGDLVFPEGVKEIGPFAFDSEQSVASGIGRIELPSTLELLGAYSFRNVKSKEIIIKDGIKTIGAVAFEGNTSVEKVEIPSSVTQLGGSSMGSFASLKELYCYNPEPPMAGVQVIMEFEGDVEPLRASAFMSYPGLIFLPVSANVYVPKGSAEKYRQAEGWEYFENFVEME